VMECTVECACIYSRVCVELYVCVYGASDDSHRIDSPIRAQHTQALVTLAHRHGVVVARTMMPPPPVPHPATPELLPVARASISHRCAERRRVAISHRTLLADRGVVIENVIPPLRLTPTTLRPDAPGGRLPRPVPDHAVVTVTAPVPARVPALQCGPFAWLWIT